MVILTLQKNVRTVVLMYRCKKVGLDLERVYLDELFPVTSAITSNHNTRKLTRETTPVQGDNHACHLKIMVFDLLENSI